MFLSLSKWATHTWGIIDWPSDVKRSADAIIIETCPDGAVAKTSANGLVGSYLGTGSNQEPKG